jgi:hypothetical protein
MSGLWNVFDNVEQKNPIHNPIFIGQAIIHKVQDKIRLARRFYVNVDAAFDSLFSAAQIQIQTSETHIKPFSSM